MTHRRDYTATPIRELAAEAHRLYVEGNGLSAEISGLREILAEKEFHYENVCSECARRGYKVNHGVVSKETTTVTVVAPGTPGGDITTQATPK